MNNVNIDRCVVVSAANAPFYGLLLDAIASIRGHARGAGIPFVVLDVGLTREQIVTLEAKSIRVVRPDWDYHFPDSPPEWFKAMTARPHLPKWVPGFDFYFWIDADAWVQSWDGVELFLEGAKLCGFAVAAEADRAFSDRILASPDDADVSPMTLRRQSIADFYNEKVADKLCQHQGLNCGVFAARGDSTIWHHWPTLLGAALRSGKGNKFFAEQTAMNVALLSGNVPFARLSAINNWVVHRALPRVGSRGELVHPDFPHEQLHIIHRTANTKSTNYRLRAQDGTLTDIGLGYPGCAIL